MQHSVLVAMKFDMCMDHVDNMLFNEFSILFYEMVAVYYQTVSRYCVMNFILFELLCSG